MDSIQSEMAIGRLAEDFGLVTDIYHGNGADDPYPELAACRRDTPVMKGDILARFNVPSQADYARCGRKVYTVFRYADVMNILRDTQNWHSSLNGDGFGDAIDNVLLTSMDGQTHRNFRALMSPPFTGTALQPWKEPVVRTIVQDEFGAGLRSKGRADLLMEFALLFPVRVVYAVLGFPDDRDAAMRCATWALQVMSGPQMDPAKAAAAHATSMHAAQLLFDYILSVVQARRASNVERNDLIGLLINARQDGRAFDDAEIAGFLRGILLPATETTTRTFANLLLHLFRHPDAMARVKADRSLIQRALQESMRLEPVAAYLARLAARDLEIAGVKIEAGAGVSLCVASAQRDDTVFDKPDMFDLDRPMKPIMGFGFGPHICLGQHIAKMEIEAAVNAVLDFPNLRLDPLRPEPIVRGMQFRCPDHLHTVWDI